jgi:dTMP kinase
MSLGKLIVIDGTDGSGKATQVKELVDHLRNAGHRVETMDFPQYTAHFGSLIGECLAGKHGDFAAMSPYVASTLYAADRFDASAIINRWLQEGAFVVLDRYVSANQIHQGGKIADEEERKSFLSWLDHMEHGIFKIPRPDMIIYLDVPVHITQRLLKEKKALDKKAEYHKGIDQHEDNLEHLQNAKESGLKMVASMNTWERIECYKNDTMLPIPVIHNKIWNIVSAILE